MQQLLSYFSANSEFLKLTVHFFVDVFFAILFLQSGLDKIFDWKGNLGWLQGHFSKTLIRHNVPVALLLLTVMEVLSGLLCFIAAIAMLMGDGRAWSALALCACFATFIALFFGQRIAKDYAGAAGIVPYAVLNVVGLALLM